MNLRILRPAGLTLAMAFLSCNGMVASSVSFFAPDNADGHPPNPRVLAPGDAAQVEIDEETGWAVLIIRAEQTGVYLVRTRGKIDAVLNVFDRYGKFLGSSDDVFDLDAALAIPLVAGETASVEVSCAVADDFPGSKLKTTVCFNAIDVPSTEVVAGGSSRGSIGPGRPTRFLFTAPSSGTVLLETSSKGELDTLLSIRDDAGVLVGWNDDRADDDYSSVVAISVERGKRYECLVVGVGREDSGTISLAISDVTPAKSDDFPNHASDPVGMIREVPAGGQNIAGSWETWNDADVIDLRFATAGLYRLEIRSALDSVLTTYDTAGRALRANDDSGRDNNARLVVEAGRGELLRARLRPLSGVEHGRWRLSIRRVGNSMPRPVRRDIGPGRVLGLAVCVSDFPASRSLADALTDAWNFRRFMEATLGARSENLRVLTDDMDVTEDDLTVPRIRAEIAALAERAGPDDIVVFLYSGHGDATHGRSRLAPEFRSYAGELLRRDLDRIKAARTVVIIDACNSGDFARSLAAPNRWVLASSRVDETSNASLVGQPEPTGGSLFLSCLFQELMYRSETKSLSETFRRAAAAVTRLDNSQHPVFYEPAEFPLSPAAR